MSELVEINTIECEQKGCEIRRNNSFFKNLCSVMKDRGFKQFYDKYFQSWNDVECMVFYMKLYDTIDHEFKERYNTNISDDMMTYTLHEIMTTPQLRKTAFTLFKTYEKDLTISHSKPLRTLLTFAK